MVVVDLIGLTISSTKVFFRTLSNSVQQAIALNAPNGNFFQKFHAVVFGIESTTQMMPNEAREILGFSENTKVTSEQIRNQLNTMMKMNDLSKGGSPYLNERFIAAAHVLTRNIN